MNASVRILAYLLVASSVLVTISASAAEPGVSIIPAPAAMEMRKGSFQLDSRTRVVAAGDARGEAAKLIDYLVTATGYRPKLVETSKQPNNSVRLRIESSLADRLGEEGYEIQVQKRSIDIRAASTPGLFYAIQTLRQLM